MNDTVEALLAFSIKVGTLAVEAITASAERKKEIADEAEAAWQECRNALFKLEQTLDDRNARNRERAKAKDATAGQKPETD